MSERQDAGAARIMKDEEARALTRWIETPTLNQRRDV